MPTGLLKYGFKISKRRGRHYPNGMMSCLYNLHEQVVYDFELVPHNDERSCAIEHFKKLSPNDLVIFDRGYFSYLMLHMIMDHNVHAVFRIQTGNVNGKIQEFLESDRTDEIFEYSPSEPVKSDLRKRGYDLDFKPISARLIKYTIKNETYVCMTTLIDEVKYQTSCFSDLYHRRWGIEELYKVSKVFIDVEDFHSQTERTVKQELYGHLLLINISRIFAWDSNTIPIGNEDAASLLLACVCASRLYTRHSLAPCCIFISDGYILPPVQKIDNAKNIDTPIHKMNEQIFKINFKNCLSVVGRHLENLILGGEQLIHTWFYKTIKAIAKLRQRVRPNRSYPRISFKPRNSWTSFGKGLYAQPLVSGGIS